MWVSPFRDLRISVSLPLPAAYHVFHRLSVPRHPPCALLCLTSRRCHTLCASLLCKNASIFASRYSIKISAFPCTFYGACRFAPSVALAAFFLFDVFSFKKYEMFPFLLFFAVDTFFSVFGFQGTIRSIFYCYGLKWTRTTDLTLIRRAL